MTTRVVTGGAASHRVNDAAQGRRRAARGMPPDHSGIDAVEAEVTQRAVVQVLEGASLKAGHGPLFSATQGLGDGMAHCRQAGCEGEDGGGLSDAAHGAVDACRGEAALQALAQQQVIDAKSGVAPRQRLRR